MEEAIVLFLGQEPQQTTLHEFFEFFHCCSTFSIIHLYLFYVTGTCWNNCGVFFICDYISY